MPYDVFISYASPDRSTVVRPLAEGLKAQGYRVWFDEFELRPGDRLSEAIDYGMANSYCGVVVLSPAFMARPWPKRELSGLNALATVESRRLVPLLHGLEPDDLVLISPALADIKCLRADDGVKANLSHMMKILPRPTRSVFAFEDALREIERGEFDVALLLAGRALDERLYSIWEVSPQARESFVDHPMEALFLLFQADEVRLEDADGDMSVELLENCFMAQGFKYFFKPKPTDPTAVMFSVLTAQRFLRANPLRSSWGHRELRDVSDRHFSNVDTDVFPPLSEDSR